MRASPFTNPQRAPGEARTFFPVEATMAAYRKTFDEERYGDRLVGDREPNTEFGAMKESSFFLLIAAEFVSDPRYACNPVHDIRRANDAVAAGIVFA